ncbi:MAG: TetR/AcrR family transcriptional regulator [Bacillota bacterium]
MIKATKEPKPGGEMKDKILEEALEIISKQGFDLFSMRKLAAKLNISATAIYYYFSSKDDIYLEILMKSFGQLHQELKNAYQQGGDIYQRTKAVIRAYIDFGINHPNQYNLMFTLILPRPEYYQGRKEEPFAIKELENALSTIYTAENIFLEFIQEYPGISPEEIKFHTFRIWSTLHGLVSLYISQTVHYYIEPTEETIEKITDYLTRSLMV